MTRERFIKLLEKEQEGLMKFLLALCDGNYPEAEDLAQETSLNWKYDDACDFDVCNREGRPAE